MRLKSELYKKEQDEIIEQIIKILDLETDIINNYLQWYYRPNILGAVKYLFIEMKACTYINYVNNCY